MAEEKIAGPGEEQRPETGAGERTEDSARQRARRPRRRGGQARAANDAAANDAAAPAETAGSAAKEKPAKETAKRAYKESGGAGRSRTAERRPARGDGGANPRQKPVRSVASAARGGGRRWRDDLRQLAIVVIGVALTIGIPEGIGRIRQRQQERQLMWQVYEELQENRAQIGLVDEAIGFDSRGMRLFQSHGMRVDAIPADSLAKYMDIFRCNTSVLIRTDALETLRSSAAVVSRCDKGLLRDIYFCYGLVRSREEQIAGYNEEKRAAVRHYMASGLRDRADGRDIANDWRALLEDPLCAAFMRSMAGYVRSGDGAKIDAQIAETLASIDKKYGFEQ